MKFKKCHLDREQAPLTRAPVALNELKKEFDRSAGCLHPDAPAGCMGKIIKAHTVQRATSLNSIAHDGHVLRLSPDGGASRLGVGSASTFRGFCEHHDSSTFRELETGEFRATRSQLVRVGFRSVSQELHKKRSMLRAQPIVRSVDAGRTVIEQRALQGFFDELEFGAQLGCRELEQDHTRWGKALLSSPNEVEGLVIELERAFPLACAGTWYPEFDFQGRLIQALDEERLSSCCFATHVSSNGVFAVFAWLNPSPCGRAIARSLVELPKQHRGEALARLAFTHFENLFMNEKWWNQLAEPAKSLLRALNATFAPTGSELVPTQAIPGCEALEITSGRECHSWLNEDAAAQQ